MIERETIFELEGGTFILLKSFVMTWNLGRMYLIHRVCTYYKKTFV